MMSGSMKMLEVRPRDENCQPGNVAVSQHKNVEEVVSQHINVNDVELDADVVQVEDDDHDTEESNLNEQDEVEDDDHDTEESNLNEQDSTLRHHLKKMTCYEKFETKIGNVFERIGKKIAGHPWKVIAVIILINGLCGIGMLELETDIDVKRVYTPMNSQAIKDEERLQSLFPDKSGTDFYSHQKTVSSVWATLLVKPSSGNILDVSFLNDLHKVYDYVNATVADHDGHTFGYVDICAMRDGQCVVEGDVFLTSQFYESVAGGGVSYPIYTLTSGATVNLQSLLGGVEQSSGKLTKATHLKLQFNIRSDTMHFKDLSTIWLKQFISRMKSYSSSGFDFVYAHYDSLSDELNANIGGDIGLFAVTFTLMITYACVATYSAKHDCVGNRMMLGFGGVLAAGLGIVASFGLVSACGMSFVSIVGNAPFLILGIGVDDMFILLSGLSNALYEGDTHSRIGQMMRTSGVAITITSLTDIIAFATGALSSFKGVRNFCVFTGVAVLFCYINQVTLFVSCLAVKENHVNDNRHAVCCLKTKSKETMEENNFSKPKIFCCAGTPPKSRKDVESCLERYPNIFLSKFVLLTPVKIFIVIFFAVYLGVSIWGIINLKQGLVVKDLVADDSYFYKYTEWDESFFVSRIPVGFYIYTTLDYSSVSVQKQIENMMANAKADSFISNTNISWLDSYLNSVYHSNSTSDFVTKLQGMFFSDPKYKHFSNDVIISGGQVTVSRVYVLTNEIESSQDEGQMMLNMRDIASDSGLPVIAFSPPFVFYEQYVAILPQTLQTLGIAIAAVFVVTGIFLPHPLLLLYIIAAMGMIMTGIIGFMTHWGLALSSVTMIHLIMTVGFAVDFTAHICHAYMMSDKDTRNERVKVALESAGAPIFNGAVSSVIGIFMLSFAKSFIFKSFFQVMLLVILFGLAHAVLLLPVVLSTIGPLNHRKQSKPQKEKNIRNRKTPICEHEMSEIKKKDSKGHIN